MQTGLNFLGNCDMKVKALIKLLLDCEQDADVILQKDSEGNGFSPISGVDPDIVYVPNSQWSGEVYSTQWTADAACMEEAEWQKILKKKRSVVLYPVN
jgi:hypothetical protein